MIVILKDSDVCLGGFFRREYKWSSCLKVVFSWEKYVRVVSLMGYGVFKE